ncbi:MAG: transcription elongation factor GreA [Clostridiales bacterium GWF2_38_85]|nr:MAG: transcription elongation factor GreA [Clostridiales bacterium GWF2_38_85]HBL85358.1 transcription elongation factor GreA [Clostridiales bacterium]
MNAQNLVYLTKEGLEKLKAELEHLVTVKRKEVGLAISKARAFGDLSENSEYDEAKNEQAEIEIKIAKLESTLKYVVVIDDSNIKTDKVSVGCKVKVFDLSFDEECEYTIVSAIEAEPMNLKISDESPLGKALIGSKIGETVTFETPSGVDKMKILKIAKM